MATAKKATKAKAKTKTATRKATKARAAKAKPATRKAAKARAAKAKPATRKVAKAKAKPATRKAAKAKPVTRKVAKAKAAKPATRKVAKAKRAAARKAAPLGFKDLAPWRRVPLAEAEGYDLLAASNESIGYEDCFGREPSHVMVHAGSVRVAGPVVLDGWRAADDAQQTMYVIDGDLTIDGALVFDQPDIMTTLLVTGTLRAGRVACGSTAVLLVGGLEVADVLVTDLEDGGHLVVRGPTAAPVWIDLTHGRGCVELAEPPRTRFLSDHYAEAAAEGAADGDEREEGEAYRRGHLKAAPASPALVKGLVVDESVNWRKLCQKLLASAPILA